MSSSELKSLNDVITDSLIFVDEDSRDSGFESNGSENEDSPVGNKIQRSDINHNLETDSVQHVRRSLFCEDVPSTQCEVISSRKQEVTSCKAKTVLERMETDADLIGDGTTTHRLQTVSGRHKDLKSLTPYTVSQLLDGKYDDVISCYQIIDCRYPYEYEGGHIENAMNLYTETMIRDHMTSLSRNDSSHRTILIFHCEFSSERGPKLLRYLRNVDRKLNSDRYPFLFCPEVYLLDGGYKAFFQQNQNRCTPETYVPMNHQDYCNQLRHFRVRSRSLKSGMKQTKRIHHREQNISPLKCILVS